MILEVCVAQSAIFSVAAKLASRNSVCGQSVWGCARRLSSLTHGGPDYHDGLDRRGDPDHDDLDPPEDVIRRDRDRGPAK
jgi:hypothetical protein